MKEQNDQKPVTGIAWYQNDSKARARYTTDKLREMHEGLL